MNTPTSASRGPRRLPRKQAPATSAPADRKLRLFTYARISSKKQETGSGIARQDAYAEAWAEKNGYVLDRKTRLEDLGFSGYHGDHIKRGALGWFIESFDRGDILPGEALVLESLDRLSRQEPVFAREHFDRLIRGGIRIITTSDDKEFSLAAYRADKTRSLWAELVFMRANEESDSKSRRARGALKTLCERWAKKNERGFLVGAPRVRNEEKGTISQGTDPSWVLYDRETNRIELAEPGETAVRRIVALYMEGHGALAIARRLKEEGLTISRGKHWGIFQIQRALESRSLIGEKVFNIEGEEYVLEGYYPPILKSAEWDALRLQSKKREVPRANADVPPILTANGIAFCRSCGYPLIAMNQYKTRSKLGRTFIRRLRCSHSNQVDGACSSEVDSCKTEPIERAVLTFCGDQSNLDRFFKPDAGANPAGAKLEAKRAEVVSLQAKIAKYEERLEDEEDPLTKTERKVLRDTEAALERVTGEVLELERDARVGTVQNASTAKDWRALQKGVLDLDPDARMKARKLVADTFERVEVHLQPYPDADKSAPVHLRLWSRQGGAIGLAVDRITGEIVGELSEVEGREEVTKVKRPARVPRTRTK
ncbi:recombinase family protein [Paraburkholderia sp. EG304]|uniref:recombinase family protein n=1 Tax=Paraburkholderia sp. EG304 TaxID=3237015 RepID=UPI00397E4889